MDHLRQGIGLRGYGQRDPKQEYKKEGYEGFIQMLSAINHQFVSQLMRVQGRAQAEEAARLQRQMQAKARQYVEGRADARGPPGEGRGRQPRASGEGRGEGGPERPVPLRQRQEVQEVPRRQRGPAELTHRRRTAETAEPCDMN